MGHWTCSSCLAPSTDPEVSGASKPDMNVGRVDLHTSVALLTKLVRYEAA